MRHLRALFHVGPRRVEVRHGVVPKAQAHMAVVETVVSALSAGTELLVYRNEVPPGIPLDTAISSLSGRPEYPFAYGYACAGRVQDVGAHVDDSWNGRRVFCFHPHGSHFVAPPSDLLVIPDDLSFERAVIFPNMESAVNLVQDGRPMLGDDVIVFGLGVVGLLTVALLARFPLGRLAAVDPVDNRRRLALAFGAHEAFAAADDAALGQADLVYEISGAPDALNAAIAATRFGGRLVVGSWYGSKVARVDLGSHFHRGRIQIISSQVSTIAPELTGRWDKARRRDLVWRLLRLVDTPRLTTHRFPIERAAEAFDLLDRGPLDEVLQVIFTYGTDEA